MEGTISGSNLSAVCGEAEITASRTRLRRRGPSRSASSWCSFRPKAEASRRNLDDFARCLSLPRLAFARTSGMKDLRESVRGEDLTQRLDRPH